MCQRKGCLEDAIGSNHLCEQHGEEVRLRQISDTYKKLRVAMEKERDAYQASQAELCGDSDSSDG